MPTITGTPGNDSLVGGSGAGNISDSAGGDDTIVGGAGNDDLILVRSNVGSSAVIDGGDGDDFIAGTLATTP